MKVYTGSGDKGKTSLFSGERVPKNNQRINAFGDVDELNSILGTMVATLSEQQRYLIEQIEKIQSDLLNIGAWLATTSESEAIQQLKAIPLTRIQFLEKAIDAMEKNLPTLKGFILPGGTLSAGLAHMARTVCRRAERRVVGLMDTLEFGNTLPEPLQNLIIYLNRLSDYLFVLARFCNYLADKPDTLWKS